MTKIIRSRTAVVSPHTKSQSARRCTAFTGIGNSNATVLCVGPVKLSPEMPRNPKGGIQRDVSTQTNELDDASMLEIARLQEQLNLLTIENKVLRDHTVQRAGSVTRSTPRKANTTITLQDGKNARSSKGCSCKGNCSSKLCGCVKKDKKCDHLCRCSNLACQNQGDQDGDKSPNHEYFDNSDAGGLFSPAIIEKKANDKIDKYRLPSLTFDSSPSMNFSSDEENNEIVQKEKTSSKSKEKQAVQRKGRLHKRLLLTTDTDTEPIRRSRSASNENKGVKQNYKIEVHNLRKCASNENEIFTDESNDSPLQPPPKTGKYLQNIQNGTMMPLRRKKVKDMKSPENAEKAPEILQTKKKTQIQHNKENKRPAKNTEQKPEETSTIIGVETNRSIDLNKVDVNVINDESLERYENDPNFNPTKPKYQLVRTPPRSSSASTLTPSPIERISDILLPPPISEFVEEEDSAPRPELLQDHVDWDEHQAQLVQCDKCKRKFNSFRIKKHKTVCKGV